MTANQLEMRRRNKAYEALNQGGYLEALHSVFQSSRSFEKAMIQAKTKLENGGFAQEGRQELALSVTWLAGPKVYGSRAVCEQQGNSPRSANLMLKFSKK